MSNIFYVCGVLRKFNNNPSSFSLDHVNKTLIILVMFGYKLETYFYD